MLKHAAVTFDDVLTLTDLPGRDSLKPEDTRWFLVDHNVMAGTIGQAYGNRVVGCVDHHDDEGKLSHDAKPRVIEKCGSCMSLVVEQCREEWDALSKEDSSEEALQINTQLAYLALGPILIDTSNLRNKDKTTPHDERAVAIAESKIITGSGYDRKEFFANVSALKEDISYMSFRDIFRKDYKEWTEGQAKLGTSSVPQSFAFLVRKAEGERAFVRELEKWSAEKELDVVAVLTAHKEDGKFTRELLVWARTGPGVVKAAKKFAEEDGTEKLGLGPWGDGGLDAEDGQGSWRRCWTQAKLENSRKQIAPMLRDALKGVTNT